MSKRLRLSERLLTRLEKWALAVPPLATALCVIALGGVLGVWSWSRSRTVDEARFARLESQIAFAAQSKASLSVQAIKQAVGLFDAVGAPTKEQFARHAQAADATALFPGFLAMGYAPLARATRFSGSVSRARIFFTARVAYISPLNAQNRKALGYDLASEPQRRAALARAVDSGQPAATRAVPLLRGPGGEIELGTLVFAPVYRGGFTPRALRERRARATGFVYGAFRARDLFTSVLDSINDRDPVTDLKAYDGRPDAGGRIFFDSSPGAGPRSSFKMSSRVNFADQEWTLEASALPAFASRSSRVRVWSIALLTGLVALGASGIHRLVLRRQAAVEASERSTKRWADENAKLYREAQEINRLKDEFLATLSHELRTPLNVIQGHAELISEDSMAPDAGPLRESAEAIARNSKALTAIVDDLLDVSSLITGSLSIRPRRMRLRDAVDAAIEANAFAAHARGVSLAIDDAAAEPCEIMGDPDRIKQIIWNLVSNAVKFAARGGHVRVTASASADACAISVRDDGAGIDPAFLPYVFDRFRQEDGGLTRKHGGLGLGLAIARQLAELHGGRIEARSAGRGKGAEFTARFPLAPVERAAREAEL